VLQPSLRRKDYSNIDAKQSVCPPRKIHSRFQQLRISLKHLTTVYDQTDD